MTLQTELNRLDAIINSDDSTDEQRDTATEAWERLLDQATSNAWNRIRARSAQYDALIGRLSKIVDNIEANSIGSAMDDLNGLLNDVQTAANPQGA